MNTINQPQQWEASAFTICRWTKRVSLLAYLVGLILFSGLGNAQEISVSAFGARPNEDSDSTAAIQAALNYCSVSQIHVLKFEPGVYNLSAAPRIRQALMLQGANGLVLQGNSTVFRMNTWATVILIEKCSDIVLSGISFDWTPLPFAEVQIKSFSNEGTVLEILGGTMPTAQINLVSSMFQYDVVAGRPAAEGLDWYSGSAPVRITPLSEDTALLPTSVHLSKLPIGTAFVVRYQTYGADAILAITCEGITIKNVSVYSAPGMAAAFEDCNSVTVSHLAVDVPTNSGRWISTCADALHFTLCRGGIDINNSTLRKMGDDAINVSGLVMTDTAGGDSHTVRLRHGAGQGLPPMKIGDKLEFASRNSPYSVAFSAIVRSCPGSGLLQQISSTLDSDIPSSLRNGAVVIDSSAAPAVSVVGCVIGNNRARGLWIETSNVYVYNCVVSGCSGPAAELRCDVNKWWEGPGPSNVAFNTCTFQACNYGAAKNMAVVDSYALNSNGVASSESIINNITFKYCNFPDSTAAMAFLSTGKVWVEWCKFPAALHSIAPILVAPAVELMSFENIVPEGVMVYEAFPKS